MAEQCSSACVYSGPCASYLDGVQFLLSENLACLRNDSNSFKIETQHKHRLNRLELLRAVWTVNFGSVSKAGSCFIWFWLHSYKLHSLPPHNCPVAEQPSLSWISFLFNPFKDNLGFTCVGLYYVMKILTAQVDLFPLCLCDAAFTHIVNVKMLVTITRHK